jgi:hypothetical protein
MKLKDILTEEWLNVEEEDDHIHTVDPTVQKGRTSWENGHDHSYNLYDEYTSEDKDHKHKIPQQQNMLHRMNMSRAVQK